MGQLKIHAISDTHGNHTNYSAILNGGDLLIHAGDAECMDKKSTDEFIAWCAQAARDYNYGMLFIPGNHDQYIADNEEEIRQRIMETNIKLLINEGIEIAGLKIFGSPYSELYGDTWTSFAKSKQELKGIWNLIPEGTDILITHSPPCEVLDGGVGSESLLKRVELVKPKVHIFGHIHHEYGVELNSQTAFINASSIGTIQTGLLYPIEIIFDCNGMHVVDIHRKSLRN